MYSLKNWLIDSDLKDENWFRYSVQCRAQLGINLGLISPHTEELETIYIASEGDTRIVWQCGSSEVNIGWRETDSGTREEVIFYGGEWGWLSADELFLARQHYPKSAP